MSDKQALPDSYLEYPHRSYGMDHDAYEWSQLADRKPVEWPQGKRLALWVNVCVQFFPLNQQGKPFAVPGGMTMPYPDLRHFSLRDYGNRVGIFRVLKALDQYGVKPTIAINGEAAERLPYLMQHIQARGDEVIAHGLNMDTLHYSGLDKAAEQDQIDQTMALLAKYFSGVKGWLSPARSESPNTPKLLANAGLEYFCDWVNDDMPYAFKTAKGALTAMPLSNELEDFFVLKTNLHSPQSWANQICDACDMLLDEATNQGGRILALNIHPWLMGQPHRIKYLEQALAYVTSKPEVWSAPAGSIFNAWQVQQ